MSNSISVSECRPIRSCSLAYCTLWHSGLRIFLHKSGKDFPHVGRSEEAIIERPQARSIDRLPSELLSRPEFTRGASCSPGLNDLSKRFGNCCACTLIGEDFSEGTEPNRCT